MGLKIDREEFTDQEYTRFGERLEEDLIALRRLLERPGFGTGQPSIGAELELFLLDAQGRPLPRNQAVQLDAADPRVALEIDRFNLELNLTPAPLAGRPFSAIGAELATALNLVRRAAAGHGGQVAMIGILPTLRPEDLRVSALTDARRYRALNHGLRRLRTEPFRIRIGGDQPLELLSDDVAIEGANTSLQVHLRVEPAEFARTYNAVQLATGPALAVAGNSPTFLGCALWEETRVALFKQAVDDRDPDARGRRLARVAFGTRWVREGALELFEESVRRHEPVLPVTGAEDPLEEIRRGHVPALHELRLHQGTVWSWNRAIYDPACGGHLRIEMRSLPAGPTVTDMLANAAFIVGLTLATAVDADRWTHGISFERTHRDFYRAAQDGLRAELAWPVGPNRRIQVLGAAELVRRLVPVARQGLEQAGVAGDEADRLLAVIDARARTGQTGATWQRRTLAALEPSLGRERALAAMLDRYMRHAATGAPVHSWPVPDHARPAPAAARRRLLELRAVPPVSASRTSS
jgi:gamma-glutamyl:cysteine ligase YbdK (ATP-grasp superfamily)